MKLPHTLARVMVAALLAVAIVPPALAQTDPLHNPVMVDGKPLDIMALLREMVGLQKPGKPTTPGYSGDNSCQWANDGECDDPGIGTGACLQGTDYSDCWRIATGREDDSCQWANDGECDEPSLGTGACTQGTDRSDCGDLAYLRFQNDTCSAAFNGVCDEPGVGNGACLPGTDRSDCIGRERPSEISDHFYGVDERVLLDTAIYPWSAIGWFEADEDGAICTASLIGEDIIVTAAHCIEFEHGINARGTFQTGFGLPGGARSANVIGYLVSRRRAWTGAIDSDEDWALLRIDRPLGAEIAPLGYRVSDDLNATLYQAGYSWDTGDNLSGHLGCAVLAFDRANELRHNCDTTRGDSGSPLMILEDGQYVVIATDSAFDFVPYEPAGYIATRSTPWVPLVDDFIAGRLGEAVIATPSKK